jgi:hypothetical protein
VGNGTWGSEEDLMPLWRDVLATILIGVAFVVYAAWAIGTGLPVGTDVSAVAIVILVLGVAASLSAVVPGWDELVSGPRLYFGTASVLGLIALVGGLVAVVTNDARALGLLILGTVVLWAISTARHLGVHRREQRLHPR